MGTFVNSGWSQTFRVLGTKTLPHPTACKLQCWDASGQTTNRVGKSPTYQQTGCLKTSGLTATSRHTAWQGSAHQRAKTQLHPPVGRHQPFPPGSPHKPLYHSHPLGSRRQKQGNYSLAACRTESTAQIRTYPGTNWPLALGWQEGSVLLGHIGHPLQGATSPRFGNITKLLHM